MHIAICDDNVADRKQLERLLKRESDKRAGTDGVLYVNSYGHPETLLKNPMQYDVFFLDMCHTENTSCKDIVDALIDFGSTSPIILCCSEIDYRNYSFSENVLFLDKPIKTDELCTVLDNAQKIKNSSIPTIELREDKGTYYVTETDILYAIQDGYYLITYLSDGRQIRQGTTVQNFFAEVEHFPVFFSPNSKCVINGRYIQKIAFHKLTMCDGRIFKAFGSILAYAKQIYESTR